VPLWPLAPSFPGVVNGKWLKGAGGAAVWADPAGYDGGASAAAVNTDLAHPDPAAPVATIRFNAGGGSIRSIGVPVAIGARIELQLYSGFPAVTLLSGAAGTGTAQINIEGSANALLEPGCTASLTWIGAFWVLTGISSSTGGIGPRCFLNRNSTFQSIPNGTITPFAWTDADSYDTDNMHDPATNPSRIVIKTPGVYVFSPTIVVAANATGLRSLGFLVNGGTYYGWDHRPAVTPAHVLSRSQVLPSLAINDYVEVVMQQTSGGALNAGSNDGTTGSFTQCSVERIA
jgi:hypothetical protein